RKRPPRRQRTAPENPAPAPQDARRPGRQTALTAHRYHHQPRPPPAPALTPQPGASTPANTTNPASAPPEHPKTRAPADPDPGSQNVRPKREDKPHRNVKTSR